MNEQTNKPIGITQRLRAMMAGEIISLEDKDVKRTVVRTVAGRENSRLGYKAYEVHFDTWHPGITYVKRLR